MKKLFGIALGLSVCASIQCCEIQEKSEQKISEQKIEKSQQGPVSIQEILKKIEELPTQDKATLGEILELRIRYILIILAEHAATSAINISTLSTLDMDNFDTVMLKIRTKLEALSSEQLSRSASNLLAAIDDLTNKKAPRSNYKLFSCFMDLRYDFTQKFFHTFGKKLIPLLDKYKVKYSELAQSPDKPIYVQRNEQYIKTTFYENLDYHFEELIERDKQSAFHFFSLKNVNSELAETVPTILYALLKNRIVKDKKNGINLLRDLQLVANDYNESNKAFALLKKTCTAFESSISTTKNAQPLFELYKELLKQLDPSCKELAVLDALLLLNSKKLADLETVTDTVDMLQKMYQIITTSECKKWVNNGVLFLQAPYKNNFEKAMDAIEKTPGFNAVFGEKCIISQNHELLFKWIPTSFIDQTNKSNKMLCTYINNHYLLYPLMNLFISNLEETAKQLKQTKEKKEIKKKIKKQKAAINAVAAELLKSEKTATSKKKPEPTASTKQETAEKEFEEVSEISGDTSESEAKIESKPEEEIKELREAVHETCAHLKLQPKHLALGSYNFFKTGTNTPSGIKNGLIIMSPENQPDCAIKTEAIDFGKLKRLQKQYEIKLDAFHKLPFKALQNPKILEFCQQYDIDKTDSNLLQNLCSIYHITIPTTIKTMLVLPCSMKLTGAEADSAEICFNALCKKITTEKSTDLRQPGLHEGAIVCLLEEDTSDKNKFHIYHLDFHGTEDTKKFVGNKKFGS